MNLITKAHLEGVEMFNKKFGQFLGIPSVKVEFNSFTDADVLSFLTTYGINLLNATKEAGPEEKEEVWENGPAYRVEVKAHNSCRSSFISAIDEGIEGIKKGKI